MSDAMTGIVWSPIGHSPIDSLVVLDATRRLYGALSRSSEAWHVIQPARPHDPRVGDGKRLRGELICCCPGAYFHGTCWATELAEAFESGRAPTMSPDLFDDGPVWLRDAAPGELTEAYGR